MDTEVHATAVDLLDNLVRTTEWSDTEFPPQFYDGVPIRTYKEVYDGEGFEPIDSRDIGTKEDKPPGRLVLGFVRVIDELGRDTIVLGNYRIQADEPLQESDGVITYRDPGELKPKIFDPGTNKNILYGPETVGLDAPEIRTVGGL